jgi:hypothetical protein
MILDRLWYRTDCVVRGCPFSWSGQARQCFGNKCGAAGWGEYYMFMFDWSALKTPQKATLDCMRSLMIRILSTSLTSVSIFSVCCCSRYLSLWTGQWCCKCTHTIDGRPCLLWHSSTWSYSRDRTEEMSYIACPPRTCTAASYYTFRLNIRRAGRYFFPWLGGGGWCLPSGEGSWNFDM